MKNNIILTIAFALLLVGNAFAMGPTHPTRTEVVVTNQTAQKLQVVLQPDDGAGTQEETSLNPNDKAELLVRNLAHPDAYTHKNKLIVYRSDEMVAQIIVAVTNVIELEAGGRIKHLRVYPVMNKIGCEFGIQSQIISEGLPAADGNTAHVTISINDCGS